MTSPTKHKKDIAFVFRAVVYSLLIAAIIHSFAPNKASAPKFNFTAEESENLIASTQIIGVKQFASIIAEVKKPMLVMIYASWCSYCREMMPHVNALQTADANKQVHFVYLSVDKKLSALAKYILGSGLQGNIQPVYVANEDPSIALSRFGAAFSGSIPYILLLDNKGQVFKEFNGIATPAELKEAFDALLKSQSL